MSIRRSSGRSKVRIQSGKKKHLFHGEKSAAEEVHV